MSRPIFPTTLDHWAGATLAASFALLLGALAFQHVGGLPPCQMCYWQRYGHLAVLAFAWGALLPVATPARVALLALAGVALLATAGIGAYHAGVEWKWWQGPAGCSATSGVGKSLEELRRMVLGTKMVRCDEIPWSLLGLSMAGWNALISAALAAAALTGAWRCAARA
ncbi:MAG: disulfide bond formation protein B [Rhodospirillales bacterium]|nr:MAG: disulfide bond formation protein B [Rhodospirillales bacterium]